MRIRFEQKPMASSSTFIDHMTPVLTPGHYVNGNYVCPVYGQTVYKSETFSSRSHFYEYKSPIVRSDFVRPTDYTFATMKWLSGEQRQRSYYTDPPGYCNPRTPGKWYSESISPIGLQPIGFPGLSINPGPNEPPRVEIPSDKLVILNNELLSRVSAQKLQAGVALAEARKTAQFLQETVLTIARSVGKLKKGNIRGAIQDLYGWRSSRKGSVSRKSTRRSSLVNRSLRRESVAQRLAKHADAQSALLLKYRYALSPLLADIDGSINLLANGTSWRLGCKSNYSWTTEFGEAKARAGLVYILSDTGGDNFRRIAQSVGLSDILGSTTAQVLWELLPFSFIIDMVANASQVLELYSASRGLVFDHGYNTVFYSGTVVENKTSESYRGEYIANSMSYTRSASYAAMRRIILGGFPTPKLEFSNPLNLYNVATISALVYQLTRNNGKINFNQLR